MAGMIHCQLWMGSLEPYMTESFIMIAFQKMGEHPQNVKLMRNKFSGEPAGYCFVHFPTDEQAIDAMHKLNGKPIPGTNPVVRFRLNNASSTGRSLLEREFSVWVGDLSPDVDDYSLYRAFASRYNTIKTAKVILDNSGFSKGYGFVRFGSEEEQKNSLTAMNGYVGLGTKALKICNAVPKPKGTATTPTTTGSTTPTPTPTQTTTFASNQDYAQYYDPSAYWQNYTWQGYYDQTAADFTQTSIAEATAMDASMANGHVAQITNTEKMDDELELIEHTVPIDIDKLNRERIEQDRNLWDALESSKWLPCEGIETC